MAHRMGCGLAALMLLIAFMAAGGGTAMAQAETPFVSGKACRADYRQYCRATRPGSGAVSTCLREHAEQLSSECRVSLEQYRSERRRGGPQSKATSLPQGARVQHDVAYGPLPQQRMDIYSPDKKAENAPVIVMLHGGAWARGSKTAANVVDNKVTHWLPKGYIFVSVETRLLPAADPLLQASDLASALAMVQQKAASWGGDPDRIVLMGHSSGAHVAALLSVDKAIAATAGVKPWRATVALDSAAYDIGRIMRAKPARLYQRAFGEDPAYWAKVSPALQLDSPKGIPAMLLVCSSLRRSSCDQARDFAAKAGGKASTLVVALRHEDINTKLGTRGIYTDDVDAFLRRLGFN